MTIVSNKSVIPPAVRLHSIHKTFDSVVANNGIDLDVNAGEIHAILGENGAGKSTLMNIVYGLIQPDDGQIEFHGRYVKFISPADAIKCGIAMVHQQFMLVPRFTVVENIVLGLGTPRGPFLSLIHPAERIQRLSEMYRLKVDPWIEVGQLSVGEQQRVEIIKALYRNVDILILDEPTSVLTPQEIDQLFSVLRAFARQGHTVIFISHKFNEVLAISDRITVMRDGVIVGTVDTHLASKAQLARMMVGREISLDYSGEQREECGPTILKLEGICAENERGLVVLSDVNLQVRKGEILGIAGVDGNGQRELADLIVGLRKAKQGKMFLEGEEITNHDPYHAIIRGIGYIPGNRREYGMLPDLPIWRNMLLGRHDKPPYIRKGLMNFKEVRLMGERLLHEFDIRPADLEWLAISLSGGNQQKLMLSREIDKHPRLLIASQPTSGLDIKTTEYVRRLLLKERNNGLAILLISTDLQEILSLSDRIAVMYNGKIMGIVDGHKAKTEQLGLMMAGISPAQPGGVSYA